MKRLTTAATIALFLGQCASIHMSQGHSDDEGEGHEERKGDASNPDSVMDAASESHEHGHGEKKKPKKVPVPPSVDFDNEYDHITYTK